MDPYVRCRTTSEVNSLCGKHALKKKTPSTPLPCLSLQDVAEEVDAPLEATSKETAPVATAVESVDTENAAAVVSGEGNGKNAPPDDAVEGKKPADEKDVEGAVLPEAKEAVSDDAKPTEPPAAAKAAEDVGNGNGNGNGAAAVESNGEAGAVPAGTAKEGEENGEIKQDKGHAEAGKAGEEKAKAGAEEMEVEAPPKEDLIVDYTDEFGRVRQMLQR